MELTQFLSLVFGQGQALGHPMHGNLFGLPLRSFWIVSDDSCHALCRNVSKVKNNITECLNKILDPHLVLLTRSMSETMWLWLHLFPSHSLLRWHDSGPVSIQMWVRGESTVYSATDVCLSVNKLNKEKKEENNVSAQRSVSTCVRSVNCSNWEYLHKQCRYATCDERKKRSVVANFFWSMKAPSVSPVTYNPSSLESDRVLGPSRCFVKRSVVLSFVYTRHTDGRFSLVHCCKAKHRMSMCMSPLGHLLWNTISRQNWHFVKECWEKFCKTQQLSCASTWLRRILLHKNWNRWLSVAGSCYTTWLLAQCNDRL